MIKLENVSKKYGEFYAVKKLNFEINEGEIVGFLGRNGAGKSTTMNMITGFIQPTEGKITIGGFDIDLKPKKAKALIGYMPEGVPLYTELTVKEFVSYMADLKLIKRSERKSAVNKAILELIKSFRKNHTVILSSHILSEVSQICEKVIIIDKGEILVVDTPENLENDANKDEDVQIQIVVEDTENTFETLKDKISDIKEIVLQEELDDGSKKYSILVNGNKDIRKEISLECSKSNIIILEMKKEEKTLEDAFIKLVDKRPEITQKEREEIDKEMELNDLRNEARLKKEEKSRQKELKKNKTNEENNKLEEVDENNNQEVSDNKEESNTENSDNKEKSDNEKDEDKGGENK